MNRRRDDKQLPPEHQNSEDVRLEVASKLMEAVTIAERLARTSARKPAGSGGIPPKVRWYQLMGYLSQTLDGVLRNMDMNEVKKRMAELEKMVVSLREQDEKIPG